MNPLRTCAIVGTLALGLASGLCHAQTAAEFYGRTSLRLLISADPGGSYDSNARLVARHLGKHIPGNPRIVAEQMVGASGRIAANYLYNVAPKDGSVIALVQQSVPMGQVTGEPGVQYDAGRFNWIGSPILLDDVLVVWHATGVRTMEDAKKKEVVIGATSTTGTNYLYPKITNELLGTKFKIVTGYQGATPIKLALERGEVEGHGSNPWSDWKVTKPDWVRDKKIIPLMQMSLEKHPDLPDVPLLIDLATTGGEGGVRADVDHRRYRPTVRDGTRRPYRTRRGAARGLRQDDARYRFPGRCSQGEYRHQTDRRPRAGGAGSTRAEFAEERRRAAEVGTVREVRFAVGSISQGGRRMSLTHPKQYIAVPWHGGCIEVPRREKRNRVLRCMT
jgi:tripartite-type tricarboxylate transporter receptor subunit TctC